jgi:hypothetical protein
MKPRAFRLNINCDNAAFEEFPAEEIARILRAVADRIDAGDSFDTYRNILDINGNIVGQFALKPYDQL